MQSTDLMNMMKREAGQHGSKYVSWYNSSTNDKITIQDDWSAAALRWCAEQCNIPADVIPLADSAQSLADYYKKEGEEVWKEPDPLYAPPTGALVFIKINNKINRVCVVESCTSEDDGTHNIRMYGGDPFYQEFTADGVPTTDGRVVKLTSYTSRAPLIAGYVLPKYVGEPVIGFFDGSGTPVSEGARDGTSPFPTHIFDEYENLPSLAAQPYYAFVDLYIGDHAFPNIPPQYLVSLSVDNILLSGSSNVTLVLYDKYSDEIEEVLYRASTMGEKHAYIRYGHTSGRQSRLLGFTIVKYNIDLQGEGSLLTIHGTTQAFTGTNFEGNAIFTAGVTPSDAVKWICDHKLENVTYTDESIHPSRQLIGSDGETISFNLIREKDYIGYIKRELCPRAVREEDGLGGYQFYIDDTVTPNVAHFHPLEIPEYALRTYVYQKGVNSNVVSLSITNDFLTSGMGTEGTASDLVVTRIDPITNEETTSTRTVTEVNRNVKGESINMKKGQSTELVDTGAMSYGEAVADLEYRINITNLCSIDMTIVGDPTLTYAGYIRLIVLTRNNNLHQLSGIYTLSNLSMTIQDGIMLSTMHLTSAETLSMDGVDLLKYKKLYK